MTIRYLAQKFKDTKTVDFDELKNSQNFLIGYIGENIFNNIATDTAAGLNLSELINGAVWGELDAEELYATLFFMGGILPPTTRPGPMFSMAANVARSSQNGVHALRLALGTGSLISEPKHQAQALELYVGRSMSLDRLLTPMRGLVAKAGGAISLLGSLETVASNLEVASHLETHISDLKKLWNLGLIGYFVGENLVVPADKTRAFTLSGTLLDKFIVLSRTAGTLTAVPLQYAADAYWHAGENHAVPADKARAYEASGARRDEEIALRRTAGSLTAEPLQYAADAYWNAGEHHAVPADKARAYEASGVRTDEEIALRRTDGTLTAVQLQYAADAYRKAGENHALPADKARAYETSGARRDEEITLYRTAGALTAEHCRWAADAYWHAGENHAAPADKARAYEASGARRDEEIALRRTAGTLTAVHWENAAAAWHAGENHAAPVDKARMHAKAEARRRGVLE